MDTPNSYYPMILALQNQPLISIKELAVELDLSWPTAKKRYQDAISQGMIYQVSAVINYEVLQLLRYVILIDVPNVEALKRLEEVCDNHPYTICRSRVVGKSGFSMFIIFHIPNTANADKHLNEIFERLQDESMLCTVEILRSAQRSASSSYDLNKYRVETSAWDFDSEEWLNSLNATPSEYKMKEIKFIDLTQYDNSRLYILRQLSIDANLSLQEMLDDYSKRYDPLSKSEFHRRVTQLKEEVIHDYELLYNVSAFGITEFYLFKIPNLSDSEVNQFLHLMESNPPPFRLVLEVMEENTLIIYGNLPSQLARKLCFALWKRFSQTEIYNFSTEDGWSMRYYFYHENFDNTTKNWKDNREYMLENPLNI